MLKHYYTLTLRFIRCGPHQLHLAPGQSEFVQVKDSFSPNLYVLETGPSKRRQCFRGYLICTNRSAPHCKREVFQQMVQLVRRADRISTDYCYTGAKLVGDKTIYARRSEITLWSF